ncbi:hypothetical protein ACFS4T_17945 [Pseudomonas lini]
MIDASGGNGWLARQLALERLAFFTAIARDVWLCPGYICCV